MQCECAHQGEKTFDLLVIPGAGTVLAARTASEALRLLRAALLGQTPPWNEIKARTDTPRPVAAGLRTSSPRKAGVGLGRLVCRGTGSARGMHTRPLTQAAERISGVLSGEGGAHFVACTGRLRHHQVSPLRSVLRTDDHRWFEGPLRGHLAEGRVGTNASCATLPERRYAQRAALRAVEAERARVAEVAAPKPGRPSARGRSLPRARRTYIRGRSAVRGISRAATAASTAARPKLRGQTA